MDEAKIRGIVHVIEETKTFGQRGFQKRLVVLEQDDGRFTSYIPIDFLQANVDLVDKLSVGDEVEITYRLGGRKWQRDDRSEVKYFLSAEALGINLTSGRGSSGGGGGGGGGSRNAGGSGGGNRNAGGGRHEPPQEDEDDPIPF